MSETTNHTKSIQTMSDAELISLFKASEDRKFVAELYHRYSHLVYGSCLKYLKEREASKDMVIRIFEKLIKVIPNSEIRAFNTWLFTIVRNECISELRKKKSQFNKHQEWQIENNSEEFMENEGFVRLNEDDDKTETLVKSAVEELNKEQKQCIRLFFYEKKSYKEIVEDTGFTMNQVKSFIQNGKRNLHLKLRKHFT